MLPLRHSSTLPNSKLTSNTLQILRHLQQQKAFCNTASECTLNLCHDCHMLTQMLAVLSTTDSTELAHIKNTMSGMMGISSSISTSTERNDFLTLWNSQTASDAKFDSIRAAGGQLQSSDFSSAPAILEVYFAYVSGCTYICVQSGSLLSVSQSFC